MFDATNLQRIAVSLLGALALTGTCIGAATVPARAAAAIVTVSIGVAPTARTITTGVVGAVRY